MEEVKKIQEQQESEREDVYMICPICQKKVKKQGIAAHFKMAHNLTWKPEFKDVVKLQEFLKKKSKNKDELIDMLIGGLFGLIAGMILGAIGKK